MQKCVCVYVCVCVCVCVCSGIKSNWFAYYRIWKVYVCAHIVLCLCVCVCVCVRVHVYVCVLKHWFHLFTFLSGFYLFTYFLTVLYERKFSCSFLSYFSCSCGFCPNSGMLRIIIFFLFSLSLSLSLSHTNNTTSGIVCFWGPDKDDGGKFQINATSMMFLHVFGL